jgi:hypothetical protein
MLEPGIVVLAYANPSTRREHPFQHRVQVQRNVPTQIMLLQAAASAPDRRAQTARKADISRPVERSSTERDVEVCTSVYCGDETSPRIRQVSSVRGNRPRQPTALTCINCKQVDQPAVLRTAPSRAAHTTP